MLTDYPYLSDPDEDASFSPTLDEMNGMLLANDSLSSDHKPEKLIKKRGRKKSGKQDRMCKVCNKTFSSSGNLKTHQRVHSEQKLFSCSECDKQFNYQHVLDKHFARIHLNALFECEKCGKKFTKHFDMIHHMRAGCADEPYECNICRRSFSQQSTLRLHKFSHTDHKFECDQCGKQFKWKTALKFHLDSHTGKHPYACEVCNKKFSQLCHLREHLMTHLGIKRFECDVCGHQFRRKGRLESHLLLYENKKVFQCDGCDEKFHHKQTLKTHIKKMHSGIDTPISCQTCGKKFSCTSDHNRHIVCHTDIATVKSKKFDFREMERSVIVKPEVFECLICNKKFLANSCLKVHLRKHTGEKPYECDKCGKKYVRVQSLRYHESRVHVKNESVHCKKEELESLVCTENEALTDIKKICS